MSARRLLAAAVTVAVALSGCAVLREPHDSGGRDLRGVNTMTFLWFAGYGRDAGTESAASYAFQRDRGVSVVRLPISWERIQPRLRAPLDSAEVTRLQTEIGHASDAGIDVIVDLHNGCRYRSAGGEVLTCSRGIDVADFTDLWTRLPIALRDYPGVLGYDLMNEPNNLTAEGSANRADAEVWEQFSQAAVDAVRATGDARRLLVEGVSWSNVDKFDELHPQAWIDDPRDNTVYSAHQYFDESGRYAVPGSAIPDFRYSYWSDRLERDGTTGERDFDSWNLHRLDRFVEWVADNDVRGDIGEIGWPSAEVMVAAGLSRAEADREAQRWNALGEAWFDAVDAAGMSVTYFAASGVQVLDHPGAAPGMYEGNAVFVHGAGNGELRDAAGDPVFTDAGDYQPRVIDHANSQYEVLGPRLAGDRGGSSAAR